jgi:GGDEF domain-containing protein
LGGNTRAGDVVARTGGTSFGGLLAETDEIAAINYVERVRSACDTRLGEVAFEVRLAIGWAQPPAGGRFADAMHLAADRLNADRRGRDLGSSASTRQTAANP